MTDGTSATSLPSANSVGAPLAQHSNASADWGTPEIGRRFAACVLRPAAKGDAIDLDYASSGYWHLHWPDRCRPSIYLDGSPGRDVITDRRSLIPTIGAGFCNAPGLGGGAMVQACWEAMEHDHREAWLGSGVWWGFSLEQFASLQGHGNRSPLSVTEGITTIVPGRRARYLLHPEAYIELLGKKLARRYSAADRRELAKLRGRADDSPVTPPAPPHASYITILWHASLPIRRRQMAAARDFLAAQAAQAGSLFERVAVCGSLEP